MFLQYRNSNLAIGWNGFFEHLTKSKKNYDVSAINFVDFVYNSPSDLDTLFTAAMKSVSTAKQHNMKTCFITYDQPLYHKTRDIVGASDFEGMNVIVRLGGFHMLMPFLGCIEKIMAGSGLKELLCEVYAEGTVKHILTGHAYARAVRAHTLIQLALAQFVFDKIKTQNSKFLEIFELDEISDMFFNSTEPESSNILNSKVLNDIDYLFEEQMQKIQRRSKTAELWVLYFRMVSILKDFIAAEKSGDWMSHLRNVELMIPFFHSAGHMSYAKSAQLYLQDMHELERHMDSLEYKTFTEGGYWTIRRKDTFWSEIFADQTIEQTLMKSLSVEGGPFRRGAAESVVHKWLSVSLCTKYVIEAVEKFSGVTFDKSCQHKDSQDARKNADAKAVTVLRQFIELHNPFSDDIKGLVCISSGIIADENVDCNKAFEKGINTLNSIEGLNFGNLQLSKKHAVITLDKVNKTVTVDDSIISISTDLIFQRACLVYTNNSHSNEEFEDLFSFELATPSSTV
ncbi:hypothetical protein ALC62_10869 [Cyphomyrmex costatus]|uniref:Uncharacterized protein n=1 Tax=Cyphomyrmex costatus TaxID=456900 RepID=A0A151IDE7_9HYME|nr:hypothetical protein ALC62_10869 [Cyphomyrmex costatus]